MDASEAKAYVQRWEAVAEIEVNEEKVRSVKENWQQLNAIRRRAKRLGISRRTGDEDSFSTVWTMAKNILI